MHLINMLALILIMSVIAAGNVTAREWPEITPPPHASVALVASDMTFNGLPMRIRQFHTGEGLKRVLKFYQHAWNDHCVTNKLGSWQVIGRKRDGFYESIQVKADGHGGVRGLIGVTALSNTSDDAKPGHGFARMQDSHVINDIVSHDVRKTARTLILTNRFLVSSNTLFYRQHMKGEGWHEIIRSQSKPRLYRPSGRLLEFTRGKEHAIIIINRRDARTSVLANFVRRGGS